MHTERHIGEEVITDIASFINAEEENTDGIEEN